jgi:hypothetical protein
MKSEKEEKKKETKDSQSEEAKKTKTVYLELIDWHIEVPADDSSQKPVSA